MRKTFEAFTIACLIGLNSTGSFAQIAIPVPGAPPPPPISALPTTPTLPANPSLTPSQLVDQSVHDLSKGRVEEAVKDDVAALQRGPLLIHGNYCGIGNRPGTAPLDPLDAACRHHDACSESGTLPGCTCDQRLRIEATAIAEDPATPLDLKVAAAGTAAAMAVLVCEVPAPKLN